MHEITEYNWRNKHPFLQFIYKKKKKKKIKN